MSRSLRCTLPALVVLTLSGCTDAPLGTTTDDSRAASAPEVLAPAALTQAPRPVPFRATFIITPTLLLPGDAGYPARCPTGPTNAAASATGQGHGLHLGRLNETESDCIDFATLSLTLGEITITAANGDQIWAEFEGSGSFDPPPPNANLFCTWSIVGGTGRFVGATGAGDCADSRQLGNGTSLIILDGWIAYDASNRRNN
ncbi:MAG: hypothetical protein P8X82_19200 [Gemmatimonadales bacterium]|jgi:hypothetical protein